MNVRLIVFFSVSLVAPPLQVTHVLSLHIPPSASHSSQNQGPNCDESDVDTEEDFLDEAELAELNRCYPSGMSEAMANEVCLCLFFLFQTHIFFHRYHGGTLWPLLELLRPARAWCLPRHRSTVVTHW